MENKERSMIIRLFVAIVVTLSHQGDSFLVVQHQGRNAQASTFNPYPMAFTFSSKFKSFPGSNHPTPTAAGIPTRLSASANDAEVLLACRYYLVRKKRLPELRNKKRPSHESCTLKEYNVPARERKKAGKMTYSEWQKAQWEDIIKQTSISDRDKAKEIMRQDSEELKEFMQTELEQLYKKFPIRQQGQKNNKAAPPVASFFALPKGPTPGAATKRRKMKGHFNNPEYRQRWYKARWAGKLKTPDDRYKELLLRRLKRIPPEILVSPELTALTEEEILDACRMYRQFNSKRAETFQRRTSLLKEFGGNKTAVMLHMNKNKTNNSAEYRRDRYKRKSRASTRGYQTRLRNMGVERHQCIPRYKRTPQEIEERRARVFDMAGSRAEEQYFQALMRVNADMDNRTFPDIADVETMMIPKRLERRKDVLRRVLIECFQQRGRCIPPVKTNNQDDSEEQEMDFVTTSRIQRIGEHVLKLIRETPEVEPPTNTDGTF